MAELNKEEMIQIVEENIKRIEDKDFNVYFYVLDTKGNPSGSLEYIYQTALTLQNLGYKVTMLHQDKDFVGVGEWLGEKYSEIPHKFVGTETEQPNENIQISASDFLFIPEIFSHVMSQTKNLPCKRVIIMQNYNHLAEFMPVGITPEMLKIFDIITTTKVQEGILHSYFPTTVTHVVSPCIQSMFRPNNKPKKLVVNLVTKSTDDANRIIKPFYWKYPIYQWVSFNDLRSMSQETFCESLREGAITIWADDKTNFGYSALEAMRCRSILLAKLPDTLSDWNVETDKEGNETITDACLWFEHIDDVPDMLAKIVRSWTLDNIPQSVYNGLEKFDKFYTKETQEKEIERVYVKELFEKRISDFKEVLAQLKNNNEEEKAE